MFEVLEKAPIKISILSADYIIQLLEGRRIYCVTTNQQKAQLKVVGGITEHMGDNLALSKKLLNEVLEAATVPIEALDDQTVSAFLNSLRQKLMSNYLSTLLDSGEKATLQRILGRTLLAD